jgi:hypothetical protein
VRGGWHALVRRSSRSLGQLRQRDVVMVAKVYRRLKPDTEKRDQWERIAATRGTDRNSM